MSLSLIRGWRLRAQLSTWPESALAISGLMLLAYCGLTRLAAQSALRDAAASMRQNKMTAAVQMNPDGVIGLVTIPQLHVAAPITSGVGRLELIRGVGHIPGTALPGGLGTMALAGHRDTFFRSLRTIAPGMIVKVTGSTGTFRYQVDSQEIVYPDQLSILDIGSRPELVLITCYPFNFIGAAPRRFIVHAHLLSAASDEGR